MSRREALAQVAGTFYFLFYVDFSKVLQMYNASAVVSAPFDLSTSPNNSTSYNFRDFHLDVDVTNADIDAVFVQGDGLNAWVPSVPTSGQRARSIQASDTALLADLTFLGDAELARLATPEQAGTLVTFKAGLESGQTVNITDSAHASLSGGADFIINSTTITPFPPSAANTRWGYTCNVAFSDRLTCLPQRDISRKTITTPDCTDCTKATAILPSGMDENLSLTERIGGMIVYDSPVLAGYNCGLQLTAGPVNTSGADLTTIDHEPVHEAVFAGDRAYYLGTVGTFGDNRWSNGSETVYAGRVMDIRSAWSVEQGTDDWIVALGAGAPTLRADGSRIEYVSNGAGIDTASMKHEGTGPWSADADFDLYIADIDFSAVHNNVQFVWWVGANQQRSLQLIYSVGAWALTVAGTSTFNSSAPALSTATNYTLRWQHTPSGNVSRAKIWASSGAEPGGWAVTRATAGDSAADTDEFFQFFDNTTAAVTIHVGDLAFGGITYDDFNRTTTSPDVGGPTGGSGSLLRRRDMTDGSLEAAVSLLTAVYDVRATPNGQHLILIEGSNNDGPVERYSRTPTLEDSYALTNIYVDLADFNVDDAYNVYKMDVNGVLTRYGASSATPIWSVDLLALYGYRWPTRVVFGSAYGSGQTIIADSAKGTVKVCGYVGGATWTSGGSYGTVLTLARSDGSLLSQDNQVTTGGNAAAQTMAMALSGPCLWLAGAADGTDFESNTISGVNGWLMKVPY